jgi:phosphodiesterase/alkaline phosphatase D-like protein
MLRSRVAGALLVVIAAGTPTLANVSGELRCADAIAQQGRKYFKTRFRAFSKCENKEAAGQVVSCGPTDPLVQPLLDAAATRLTNALTSRCFDPTVAALSAARRIGLPCENVTTTADLIACIIDDSHGAHADALILTTYDASAAITDAAVRKCEATVAKQARKYTEARMKFRRNCDFRLSQGAIAGPCPDAGTLASLDAALGTFVLRIGLDCTDATVTDPSIDFGFPCDNFVNKTFDRLGVSNTNAIPAIDRLARCVAAAASEDADRGAETAYPLREAAFAYGVAAGDATDTSFMAWTRADAPGAVTLDVATDADFTAVVDTQNLTAAGGSDNTVKADVTGLSASTTYYYRFTQGPATSRTGTIRTAPVPSSTAPFTFAWTGDSNAFFKPFNVLEQITRGAPDAWLYIGDTIYGDDPRSGTGVAAVKTDYYTKYKENRDDSSLRDLLASVGTYAMWDDHEVTNDFYGTNPSLAAQMADGNQAFRDYMPLREDGGDPTQLYRSFKWGDVAEFFLLDCRQYRSSQAYVTEPACISMGQPATLPGGACVTEINNPARTYLGAAQLAWLENGLQTSTAKWKFVMNGPLLSTLIFLPYDRWDGYAAERFALLDFVASNDIRNVVFLSTDIHGAIINNEVNLTGLSPGPRVRELVSGAIGMDPIYRELPGSILALVPALPSLFPTIQWFDIDRFNVATVSVDQTQAEVHYYDNTGADLKTYTIPAT